MTSGNLKKLRPYDKPPKTSRSLFPSGPDAAAKGFFGFGALWFVAATGIGTLAALQLVMSGFTFILELPFGLTVEFTPDTVAAGFRHAFAWGWLTNAALGAIFFATPRLTGRPIVNPRIAVLGMFTWNAGFAAGLAILYVPQLVDPGTITGFPFVVNVVLTLGLLLANLSFWRSVVGAEHPFISLAWFGVGMLTLLGLVLDAAVVSLLHLDPTTDALAEAIWIRAWTLLFAMGVTIGGLHYLVPRLTGQPLASGALAWFGLSTWAVLGVIAIFGAAVHPSIPYALVSAGNAATMMLLVPVLAVVANLAMTLRGRWALVLSPGPLAMAMTSLVFLGGSVVLAGIGSLREVQAAVAHTEWPIGVGAFALAGAASIGLMAVGEHAWPRMLHRSHRGGLLAYAVTWSALVGAAIAGSALIAAGLFHVGLLGDGTAPEDIATNLLPIHLIAWAGLGLLGLAAAGHAVEAYLLAAHGRPVHTAVAGTAPAAAPASH